MTLQLRRIVFYILTIFFVIIGTAVIFYSTGWHFDLETFKFNKLGALFFEITPNNATITIDKNLFEFKPGLLRSGTLIANLFPKTYTVKVTGDGYQSWIKEIEVQPSLVTEVPPVLLLPEKQDLRNPIFEGINNFWVGPKHIIVLKNNGVLEFQSQKIIGNRVAQWSDSGESAITKASYSYFLINLDRPTSALNLNLIFRSLKEIVDQDQSQIQKISFYPSQENKFILSTKNGLYILDTKKLSLKKIHKGIVKTFTIKNNELFFTDGINPVRDNISNGIKILVYNLSLNTKELLTDQEFKEVKDIQITRSGYQVVILEEGGLAHLFNRKSLLLVPIAKNILTSLLSPNDKKIALVNDKKELIIYPTSDSSERVKKPEKPVVFNIGSTQENKVAWHKNSAYLFIKYPSTLYLLEGNNLPPINFQVIDLENKKYVYQPTEDSVYLLKNSSLYKLPLQ